MTSASSRRPSAAPRGAAAVVELGIVLALVLVGSLLFGPLFEGGTGVLVAAGAAGLGLVVGIVSAWTRLSVLPTMAVTGLVHILAAPWLLPDLSPGTDALFDVLAGTITVWKDALTLPLPLSSFTAMTILPWLTGLCSTVIACRLVMAGREHLGGLCALTIPVVAIVWGGRTTVMPTVLGPVLIALTLALWAAASLRVRQGRVAEAMENRDTGLRRAGVRGGVTATLLLLTAALVAAVAAPVTPTARTVLRDVFEPPLDLTEYASPLSLVRTLETDLARTELMTVSGLPSGARIRIASLDAYDGLTARIGEDTGGAARFQHVGETTALAAAASDRAVPVTFTIGDYSFPWVPTVSDTATIATKGPRSTALRETLYHDAASATVIVTAGLSTGDVLSEQVVPAAVPADPKLETLTLSRVSLGAIEQVPSSVSALATEIIGSESQPLAQIRALQQALRTGYYSDGTKSPSPSGHGAARMATMVGADSLVGDDEQYSVLMMLMCRSVGIPARVVMGFKPATDGDAGDITGEDVSAWVEIPFEGAGWVPFDVTPDRDQVPQQQTTQQVSNPEPQVLQPPLPPQDPAKLPPVYEDQEGQGDEDESPWRLPVWLVAVVGSVLTLLILVALILGLKALRRARRRRRSGIESTLGAWNEIVDHASDLGCSAVAGATRREAAQTYSVRFPTADLPRFAHAIDARVFGAGEPTARMNSELWGSADAIVRAMGADRSRWQRLAARLSIRSLLRPAGRRGGGRRPWRRIRS